MGANKVDILFVVDASDSMSPCFQKLRDNLRRFIQPLNQASFEIRYGLLAYNAGADGRNAIYEHTFIGGNDPSLVKGLYSPQVNTDKYFTSDANKFLTALESVRTQGDENTLLALDTAADFPFRTPDESRRVIALFTNEKLEDGILENEPLADMDAELLIHNEAQDIATKLSGKTAYETLLDLCEGKAGAQVDVGWVFAGGDDPETLLRRNAGRVKSLHFKDFLRQNGQLVETAVGSGIVDTAACFRFACEHGCVAVADVDHYPTGQREDLRTTCETLAGLAAAFEKQ